MASHGVYTTWQHSLISGDWTTNEETRNTCNTIEYTYFYLFFSTISDKSYTKIILVGVPLLLVLLLLLCITILAVCVACVVWRKRHCRTDQTEEVTVHDLSDNTGVSVETSTSHPNSYLGQVTANRPEIRLEPRQSRIYSSVIRAKDHHQNSPMRSLFGNRTNSTDGDTTEGGEEDGALSRDNVMNVKQYQSLRADQVHVHQYASLGATAQDEGSAQSYI